MTAPGRLRPAFALAALLVASQPRRAAAHDGALTPPATGAQTVPQTPEPPQGLPSLPFTLPVDQLQQLPPGQAQEVQRYYEELQGKAKESLKRGQRPRVTPDQEVRHYGRTLDLTPAQRVKILGILRDNAAMNKRNAVKLNEHRRRMTALNAEGERLQRTIQREIASMDARERQERMRIRAVLSRDQQEIFDARLEPLPGAGAPGQARPANP